MNNYHNQFDLQTSRETIAEILEMALYQSGYCIHGISQRSSTEQYLFAKQPLTFIKYCRLEVQAKLNAIFGTSDLLCTGMTSHQSEPSCVISQRPQKRTDYLPVLSVVIHEFAQPTHPLLSLSHNSSESSVSSKSAAEWGKRGRSLGWGACVVNMVCLNIFSGSRRF